MSDPLRELAKRGPGYAPEAYHFVLEALEHAVQLAGRGDREGAERHVSGQELLLGMREYAKRLFGPLAGEVWRRWGVREALDWGRIVFLLVDAGLLNRQESDTLDDFREEFDFDRVFVEEYVPSLPEEIPARPAPGEEED